jgi:hypothetical protein
MGECKYKRFLQQGILPSHPTMREARSLLVINPNSTVSMTDGLRPLVDALQFKDVDTPLTVVMHGN